MERLKQVKIGTIKLDNKVQITDPCYNDDVWCRITEDCESGEYTGYYFHKDTKNGWGDRIHKIGIYKDNKKSKCNVLVGSIGVDAGLAGFFNNKPNFSDSEWKDICSKLSKNNYDFLQIESGVMSSTGYGDGFYDVYANEERTAFEIRFI